MNERFFIASTQGFNVYNVDEILYFKGCGRYSEIVLYNESKRPLITILLKDIEEQLSVNDSAFFRIHKSYIVNARYLKEYCCRSKTVVLVDGSVLPVSNRTIRSFYEWCKGQFNYIS